MRLIRILTAAHQVSACAVVAMCMLAGCGRQEPEEAAAEPSRMQDAEYMKSLDAHKESFKKVTAARNEVARKMSQLVARTKERLGTDDTAKAVAELEKTAEWRELVAQHEVAKKEFEARRQETMATIRKQMNQTKKISQ